jgi:hypothetical protein
MPSNPANVPRELKRGVKAGIPLSIPALAGDEIRALKSASVIQTTK